MIDRFILSLYHFIFLNEKYGVFVRINEETKGFESDLANIRQIFIGSHFVMQMSRSVIGRLRES